MWSYMEQLLEEEHFLIGGVRQETHLKPMSSPPTTSLCFSRYGPAFLTSNDQLINLCTKERKNCCKNRFHLARSTFI
jgi:hypothetical protein